MALITRARHKRKPVAEMNVVPYIDVMLVLLIIFMVTAPLLVAGVPIDLPTSRAGALDQQAKPVQVALDQPLDVLADLAVVHHLDGAADDAADPGVASIERDAPHREVDDVLLVGEWHLEADLG